MIEKAFNLGKAFRAGMDYALRKRGIAMDDWVTLKDKEGEYYHVDLPGENPNNSGKSASASKTKESSKSSKKGQKVMSLEQYFDSKGHSRFSENYIDKLVIPRGESEKQRLARQKELSKSIEENSKKTESLTKEYNDLVKQGKIRPPSSIEKLIERAKGHPDLESTKAARRSLERRGLSWR